MGTCVFRGVNVSVDPTSTPYRRMGTINWEKSLLMRVADAVLSNMVDSE